MKFEPVTFIRLVEQGYGIKLAILNGRAVIKGASRLDAAARDALRQHKQAILSHLPVWESHDARQ